MILYPHESKALFKQVMKNATEQRVVSLNWNVFQMWLLNKALYVKYQFMFTLGINSIVSK